MSDNLKRVLVPLAELTILRPGEKPPLKGWAIRLSEPAYAEMILRQQSEVEKAKSDDCIDDS